MKQVLGTPIGTPPPGAEATALPPASADLNTNRKQVDAQTTGGVCETCHHGFINPAGFVDGGRSTPSAPGRRRSSRPASPIDTTADIVIDGSIGPRHQRVRPDAEDRRLADGAAPLRRAAGRRTLYEREGDPLDCGTVNDLAAKIAPGGYTVLNLITDLTQTPQFRTRAVGAM